MKSDRIAAMKDRNNPDSKIKKSIITTVIGELEQNSKRNQSEITDEKVIKACKKLIDANKESIEERHSDDLVKENEFLSVYIPKQLSEDELRQIITDSGAKNLGMAMGYLSKNHAGLFNGSLANKIAREMLS